jgi:hypothetical protein
MEMQRLNHLLGLIEGVGLPCKSAESVERIKGTSMFVSILLCLFCFVLARLRRSTQLLERALAKMGLALNCCSSNRSEHDQTMSRLKHLIKNLPVVLPPIPLYYATTP